MRPHLASKYLPRRTSLFTSERKSSTRTSSAYMRRTWHLSIRIPHLGYMKDEGCHCRKNPTACSLVAASSDCMIRSKSRPLVRLPNGGLYSLQVGVYVRQVKVAGLAYSPASHHSYLETFKRDSRRMRDRRRDQSIVSDLHWRGGGQLVAVVVTCGTSRDTDQVVLSIVSWRN
jgi:hypothetical protein